MRTNTNEGEPRPPADQGEGPRGDDGARSRVFRSAPRPRIVRLAAIAGIAIFALAAVASAASAASRQEPAQAAENAAAATVRIESVKEGAFLFKTATPGAYLPAPTLDTDVSIRVTGMIARTEVSQRFRNGTGSCVEGVYVFPLPEDAAVDALRMVVGGRIIEGEVREREEAKKVYEAAKGEGRKASLLEQERPNVFTTSVASIGEGDEIVVVLAYRQALRLDQGKFHLRFPMVVGPRYIPGSTVLASARATADVRDPRNVEERKETSVSGGALAGFGSGGTGWAADTDQVPDASRITPPVVRAGGEPVNPVHLRVEIDAGVPLRRVSSATHALNVLTSERATLATVTLADSQVYADRNLEIAWELDLGQEPRAAVFTQKLDGAYYALAMIVPPDAEVVPGQRLSRETVFVIDTSGSMHGTSLDGAKAALTLALERLGPEDRFNVIEFNSVTHRLFPDSRRALPADVAGAKRWVSTLEARGGTEMMPALEAALADGSSGESGSVRQVLFMTDGAVGNEEALFRYIQEHLGRSRLFTVGLGSAPNSHFMTRAAEFGRGTFTYVANPSEVSSKMTALFARLESPVLTGLEAVWDDPAAEGWPAKIPDLYAGEPLVIAARLASANGGLTIRGDRGGRPWSARVTLAGAPDGSGVDRLWAQRKIAALQDAAGGRGAASDADAIRRAVVEIAVAHHIVTPFTSLVAVDVTPGDAHGETCQPRPIPVNLPAGWSGEHVFGEMPSTATPGPLLLLGAAGLALAAAVVRKAGGGGAL